MTIGAFPDFSEMNAQELGDALLVMNCRLTNIADETRISTGMYLAMVRDDVSIAQIQAQFQATFWLCQEREWLIVQIASVTELIAQFSITFSLVVFVNNLRVERDYARDNDDDATADVIGRCIESVNPISKGWRDVVGAIDRALSSHGVITTELFSEAIAVHINESVLQLFQNMDSELLDQLLQLAVQYPEGGATNE